MTDISPETLWHTWIKVLSGEIELPGGDRYEPREPVGLGSRIMMTPVGQSEVEIVVTQWEPPHVQADRVSYKGLELTFTHSFARGEMGEGRTGGSVVVTRLDIDGPEAGDAGPVIGPRIAEDFPKAIDALIEAARVAM